ncbi:MAG: BamA/TamA family outer membrane protein [Candidatus Aminicenantes bacterium]|nr:MAG: BamA/TamA family outer membrane protein [Candidatus Aminicenantes bacterium]
MKKDYLALTSGSGIGNSDKIIRIAALILLLFPLLTGASYLFASEDLKDYTIDEIFFKYHDKIEIAKISRLKPLLRFKKGDLFNYQHLRESMENLYKIGSFDNIETRVQKKPGKKLDIYFMLLEKYILHSIKIRQVQKANNLIQVMPFSILKKKELKHAIFSLREGAYFEEEKLDDVVKEARDFLNSHGYFNSSVTYEVIKDHKRFFATVKLLIIPRRQAAVNEVKLIVNSPGLRAKIRGYFQSKKGNPYIPARFNQTIEKVKRFLKKEKYYFPEITVKEDFLDPGKSSLNLNITVNSGFRYVFKFEGTRAKMNLISSIWEKKVFEKWAVQESKARILYRLKNKGYLNAKIESKIKEEGEVKTITFHIKKGRKYTLGKVSFQGNRSIPGKELQKIIEIDDKMFERLHHLRLDSLLLDQEVLRLYYISRGFPFARVSTQPKFRGSKADIYFKIDEGKKFTIDNILFEGNHYFTAESLASFMRSRVNAPFVQQTLYKDIERLKRIYRSYGFDDIAIIPEVSPGTEKLILIRLIEGKAYRMGNLITIGASLQQRKLVEKLFPLKKNAPFDQLKIDVFKNDIESSSIFNQFKIIKLLREPGTMDILIKANPDRSIFYGFGIGWEEPKRVRGTLEYQQRNVLSSYSTFSAMLQLGTAEQRGLLSYDTPYFFKTHINSSFKVWADNEIYPSYKFYRFGVGETLIKRLTPNSYAMASLSWYRTTLNDLEITEQGIDQKKTPFDTTALNFSYVREQRDDPFNPTKGSFFSSDLKIGLPIFEKGYYFIKFRWSFQKNFKISKNGTFAASVRNGLAAGDMSITERFFAGGIKTFRGTYRDQLGPMDPLTENPKGGNALILFNFETTFPLQVFPSSDFYYSIFADIGNVFPTVKDVRFDHLQSAVGISLKYKPRMGLLRFDLALDLATGKPKFHLGIGNVF